MIIKPDLHHWGGAAAAQALYHRDRIFAVLGRPARMNAKFRANMLGNIRLAHDLARQRFADLDVMAADRMQIEH